MSALIEELKSEHVLLVDILHDVQELGIHTTEAHQKLFSAKELFLSHLKKEDEELYPSLKEEARNNPSLTEILRTFAHDIEEITNIALNFFSKYEQRSPADEFVKDFGTFYGALGYRIRKEESILYEEYENIYEQDSSVISC